MGVSNQASEQSGSKIYRNWSSQDFGMIQIHLRQQNLTVCKWDEIGITVVGVQPVNCKRNSHNEGIKV